jgi:hypothetical protein
MPFSQKNNYTSYYLLAEDNQIATADYGGAFRRIDQLLYSLWKS